MPDTTVEGTLELPAMQWWQANVSEIHATIAAAADRAQALERLGPPPAANKTVLIDKNGLVRGWDTDSRDNQTSNPLPDRGQQQAQALAAARDGISGKIKALQFRYDAESPDGYARRGELRHTMTELYGIVGKIETALATGANKIDLSRAETDRLHDAADGAQRRQEAQIADVEPMRRHEEILQSLGPEIASLRRAGIEVETGLPGLTVDQERDEPRRQDTATTGPDQAQAATIRALTEVQSVISELEQQIGGLDPRQNALEVDRADRILEQLGNFSEVLTASASRHSTKVDLRRTEVEYGKGQVTTEDVRPVAEQAITLRNIETTYYSALERVESALQQLERDGVAVERGFRTVSQEEQQTREEREAQLNESGLER